jgi:hypothetical protein
VVIATVVILTVVILTVVIVTVVIVTVWWASGLRGVGAETGDVPAAGVGRSGGESGGSRQRALVIRRPRLTRTRAGTTAGTRAAATPAASAAESTRAARTAVTKMSVRVFGRIASSATGIAGT